MRKEQQSRAKVSPERAGAHPFDVAEAEHCLSLLDPDADSFIFARGDDDKERRKRLIAEAKAAGRSAPWLWEHRRGSLAEQFGWLQEKQSAGWGSFYTVQAMRGAKPLLKNVVYIRSVFAEMDIPEPLKPWPLEPSMIVESSPGRFHVYWFVSPEDPITADDFSGIEMRLVETYGSDPDCKDLARRLRLPGTWNVKPGRPPHLVKLIHESGARYAKADLLKAFLPPRKRKPTSTTKRPLFGQQPRGLDRFVGQHQDGPLWSISPDTYGDWVRVGMALHAETNGSADGLVLWDAWSARSEKWAPGSCAEKWKSFSGNRGITGGTIYAMAQERGWAPAIRRAPDVVQKIRGAAQASRSEPGQTDGSTTSEPPHNETGGAVEYDLTDFFADLPSGDFFCRKSRVDWPTISVDCCLPRVDTGETDERGKPKMMKPSLWLRRHRPVHQRTWAPGKPELMKDTVVTDGGFVQQHGRHVLNIYRPPTIKHGDPKQAGRWLDHLDRIFPGDRHFIKWLAQRVQRPDEKINHQIVLGGPPGIGKDSLLYPVGQAIGPWNMAEASPTDLMGSFNGHQKSVILRVSEAHDLGEVDRYALYERTKTLLAAPPEMHKINEKHLRPYYVPNIVGPITTSNHRTDSLYLRADDRRNYVMWSESTPDQFTPDYFTSLYDWYTREHGCEHVAAYLATLSLEDFSPTAPPPKTDAFWAIVHAERSGDDAELADAIDKLNNPIALTIASLAAVAEGGLGEWLRDRKNARTVPHKLERADYLSVGSDAADGFWEVTGRRQRVYAHRSLGLAQRKTAAAVLAKCNGVLSELAAWAAANGVRLGPKSR